MSQIIYIVVPIAVVVLVLKVCLICWRVWAYQQRRQRVASIRQYSTTTTATRPGVARARGGQRVQAPPRARVVRVERCVTDDGAFAQRTFYAVNRPGLPTQQFQRTIVIRPADNSRPNDPNLPPSYDMAITGKDKSVKVDNSPRAEPSLTPDEAPPTSPAHLSMIPPSVSDVAMPPAYSSVPRAPLTLPTPLPQEEEEEEGPTDDTTMLLS